MAGLCVGGSNPALYISFVAGSCSQFTITSSANISNIGSQILTSGCSGVSGSLECHDNVVAGVPFIAGTHDINGNYLLTPGTTYVLRLWGAVGSNTFNICYNANVAESSSNECSGALLLGTTSTQFYNGGDCAFTGSSTDATTTDPVAAGLCAGSLENTQWIKFQPIAGVTSFQIVGTNINCTGGGCGFQFGIFSGSCSALTSEGCYGNKVCSGGQSTAGPTNTSASDGFSIAWSGTSTSGFTSTITKTGGGAFTGNEVFYLIMDGNADADCQYTLQGVNVQILPIELVSFTGYKTEECNVINWVCTTELNNDYFKLERSTDAIHWEFATVIDGAGTTNTPTLYQFKDYLYTKNSNNYYRLSQTDYNGDSRTYNLIVVDNQDIKSKKELVKITTVTGVEINNPENYNGVLIYFYSDGSREKICKIKN